MTISMRIFIIYQGFSFFNISQIWGKGNWMWWVVLFTVHQDLYRKVIEWDSSTTSDTVFQLHLTLATIIHGGTDVNLWSWPGWFTKWSLVVAWSFMLGGKYWLMLVFSDLSDIMVTGWFLTVITQICRKCRLMSMILDLAGRVLFTGWFQQERCLPYWPWFACS